MEEKGIEELKDMLKFSCSLGNAVGKSLEDGKIGLGDLPNLLAPAMAAPAAFGGIGSIPAELADLSDAEKGILFDFVVNEFDIPQDKAEEMVEKGFKLMLAVSDVVKLFQKP